MFQTPTSNLSVILTPTFSMVLCGGVEGLAAKAQKMFHNTMTTLFIILTHPSSMDIYRKRLYVEGWGLGGRGSQ
jgi:hypothetical protein